MRLSVRLSFRRSQLTLTMSVEMRAQASSSPSSVVRRMAIPIHRKAWRKTAPYAPIHLSPLPFPLTRSTRSADAGDPSPRSVRGVPFA